MRKIFVLTLVLIMTCCGSKTLIWAQEEDEAPVVSQKSAAAKKGLVNLDASEAQERVRDLERRIDDLEREKRFQDDRIRNLERTVNDLRRER